MDDVWIVDSSNCVGLIKQAPDPDRGLAERLRKKKTSKLSANAELSGNGSST